MLIGMMAMMMVRVVLAMVISSMMMTTHIAIRTVMLTSDGKSLGTKNNEQLSCQQISTDDDADETCPLLKVSSSVIFRDWTTGTPRRAFAN